jgi:hypothetical protein
LGRITAKSTTLTKIERWLRRFKASSKNRSVRLVTHPEIKIFLTEGVRSPIRRIMWHQKILIDLMEDQNLDIDEFRFFSKKDSTDITDKFIT